MAALQVAAENDMRILVQNAGLMHMRQRPIIVTLVHELIETARRVILVRSIHASEGGMQHADVEAAFERRGISRREIVCCRRHSEALAMQRDAAFFQLKRL